MNKLEEIILDKNFVYNSLWFYNNNLALRCELGIGKGKEYLKNAKNRAVEIYNILFKDGVDLFFFNHSIYDNNLYDYSEKSDVKRIIAQEKEHLKFCLGFQVKYMHKVVNDIPFDKEDNDDLIRVNRIVCYPNKAFNALKIINSLIYVGCTWMHLVSFKSGCIFSIYDDRGCDIVFFEKEKFKENYPLLEKYFLDYDRDLMKQRLSEAD